MEYLVQICGWVGTFLIVLAYYMVSNGKIEAEDPRYQLMNLIGSLAIGVLVVYQKAWAAVTLEVIWAVIAIGVMVRPKNKKTKE